LRDLVFRHGELVLALRAPYLDPRSGRDFGLGAEVQAAFVTFGDLQEVASVRRAIVVIGDVDGELASQSAGLVIVERLRGRDGLARARSKRE
jgi:hypothetical protein